MSIKANFARKLGSRVRMILALLLAFAVTRYAAPKVFVANGPNINPEFVASLRELPSTVANLPGNTIAFFTTDKNAKAALADVKTATPPKGARYTSAGKNVATFDDIGNNKRYIKLARGMKVNVTSEKVTMPDGSIKEIKVITPAEEAKAMDLENRVAEVINGY